MTLPLRPRFASTRRPLSAIVVSVALLATACSVLDQEDGESVAAVDPVPATVDQSVDVATAKEVLVVDKSTGPPATVPAAGGQTGDDGVAMTEDTLVADGSEAGTPTQTTTTDAAEVPTTPTPEPPSTDRAFPDCSSGCNYVMEGDSITFNLSQWLWPKFCTDVGAATCVNSGISGHRIDQMIETSRSDVDIHLGPSDNNVLIFWGGTNDLWQKFHSEDPAENARGAYESTKAYIAERREKGWDYVVILTHPPLNAQYVAGAEVLNELIRGNEAGADTIVDVAPDPKLADPFDPVMRSTDGVHYKDPGRQVVVEEYLIPTIQRLSNG